MYPNMLNRLLRAKSPVQAEALMALGQKPPEDTEVLGLFANKQAQQDEEEKRRQALLSLFT